MSIQKYQYDYQKKILEIKRDIQIGKFMNKLLDLFSPLIQRGIEDIIRFFKVPLRFRCQKCGNLVHRHSDYKFFQRKWICKNCFTEYSLN
ncbi:MAG: hypothetical protein ACTSPY_18510 [Candidatus Helarchaeota archaeon]